MVNIKLFLIRNSHANENRIIMYMPKNLTPRMAKKSSKETTFEDKLPLAIQTGNVLFGFKECIKSLMNFTCRMVVVTGNVPPLMRKQLEYYAYLNDNIPIYSFEGTNNDLARSCGKLHRVAVISIIDDGEADLIPTDII